MDGQHGIPGLQAVGLAGSSVAIFFGLLSFLWAQGDAVGATLRSGPTGGLAVAIIGVITALGSILMPMVRLWANERQHDRDDRFRRDDMVGKLQQATRELAELRAEVVESRQRLNDQHDLIMKLSRSEHVRTERERSGSGIDVPTGPGRPPS